MVFLIEQIRRVWRATQTATLAALRWVGGSGGE